MKNIRWILPLVMFFGSLNAAVEMALAQLQESGPIHNPLKGFRPNAGSKIYSPLRRIYVKWSDIEKCEADDPARLTSYLNEIAASAPAVNIKLVPRVYLDWDGTRDGKGNPKQYWPGDLHRFDYQSPEFLARLRRLIGRMGAAWDADPRIAFVQMGLIGWWGEMHHPSVTPSMMELLTTEFKKAFPQKKVLVRTVDEPFMNAGFGNYYDTFAYWDREPERYTQDPGPQAVPWGLINRYPDQWKSAPMEGEVEYSWQNNRPEARPLETFGKNPDETLANERFRRYMIGKFRRYHISYMGWIADFNDQDRDVVAGAAIANEAMGYRFVITQFEWTPSVTDKLSLRFSVRNDGSAPFYQKWPVALALLDPATRAVIWQTDLKVDLRTWMPGENWDEGAEAWKVPPKVYQVEESVSLPSGLKQGDYVVALAILDQDGGRLPSVRFAVKNYWKGGWHPMGFVGLGHAPGKINLAGPFDDVIRDDSLHYKVPESLLSTKAPSIPTFTPVTLFKPDANVELVNPRAYWAIEKRGARTTIETSYDGPKKDLAIHVTGDYGPDSCLHYSSEYLEKWPGGEYVMRFLMKSSAGTAASFHVADNWNAVTESFTLEPSSEWTQKELKFTLPETWKSFPRLRFILKSGSDERFSISDVHLRKSNASTDSSVKTTSRSTDQTGAGTPIVDNPLKPYGKMAATRIKVTHPKFDEAWQLIVSERPKQSWETGLVSITTERISEKDVVFLSFYGRAKEAEGGVLELNFQKNSPPWTSSMSKVLKISSEWVPYTVAFPATTSFTAGDAKLTFIIGAKEQELQIARVVLINAGRNANIEELLQAGAR